MPQVQLPIFPEGVTHISSEIAFPSGTLNKSTGFFSELGVSQVGFNIEEIEAENMSSSLDSSPAIEESVRNFMATMFALQKADMGRTRIRNHYLATFGEVGTEGRKEKPKDTKGI